MTPVARNASGSRIERSTCDSAAKLTTASAAATSGSTTRRVGDVAAHEREARRHLGVVTDRGEVRLVAGVGQLVEDRDPRPVATAEHVPHVARADEPGAAGDEQAAERPGVSGTAQPTGRLTGGVRRPGGVVGGGQLGRAQQRGHGPGVGPVALVDRAEEAAVGDVVVEDVGDLELAAARRQQVGDDIEGVRSEEVDADRDQVALGLVGLLLEADDPAVRVELGDAEPFRVGDLVEQRARAERPGLEGRRRRRPVPVRAGCCHRGRSRTRRRPRSRGPARWRGRCRARPAGSDRSGRSRTPIRRRAARPRRRRSCHRR